ncbi:MAG: DNA polymerase III subunit gamma/tau [Betaproteobacteria bacterium]|nr:DNA polymerase III subunit gamma/tau [Betaproteobacteria bacterium]
MTYQVLARKWRPKSFSALVGQEHVVRALTHALSRNRLHHAYLFTGTRGVGKTTLARILAKSLNCEAGVSAEPCGVCSACVEIDGGRFVDLLEVDAATNTRVDEMRQLLENAVYAPTRGRFKVYVIDEVHMLSNSAFNAMLKTLEEPPDHVKFILATTDPQKIPVTVLSRCLQFNLKQMPNAAIDAHLARILSEEGVPFEADALSLIARAAAGSMRDALSLLDQAIAHGAGEIKTAAVREMLGTVDRDYLFNLLFALQGGDAGRLLQLADEMAGRSLSFADALEELASLLTRIQVAQLAPQAAADLAATGQEQQAIGQLAAALDVEFVQLAYQIAIHGRRELPLAPDEYAGFVMVLLRLLAFRPETGAEGSGKGSPEKHSARAAATDSGARKILPRPGATEGSPRALAPKEALKGTVKESREPPADSDWHRILSNLTLSGMARELAQHCELRTLEEHRICLRLSPVHRHLQMKPAQERLGQVLSEYFGRPLRLEIELAEVSTPTPANVAQRERQEREDRAAAAIEQDGFVREMIEMFDAHLIEPSIKSL